MKAKLFVALCFPLAFLGVWGVGAFSWPSHPVRPRNSFHRHQHRSTTTQVHLKPERIQGSKSVHKPVDDVENGSRGGEMVDVIAGKSKAIGKNLAKKPSIPEVKTLLDFKEAVPEAEEELVVVMFYGPWCKACKAVTPYFRRLARDLSEEDVKFVRVPVTRDNALLHQGLGVPSVPFVHIYHKEAGLVEELKMKKKDFETFSNILQTYLDRKCWIPEEFFQEEIKIQIKPKLKENAMVWA
mmetsp:Transcript_27518/g.63825  ORF Transcript_27518/g.63825 Transcript_27518/m.63825 type:complete len:240 (+) Transcript_27518:84-803(+)